MKVEIEVFRDTEDRLKEQVLTLRELIPKGIQIEITESFVPYPVEVNEPFHSPAQLLRHEIQRLSDIRNYQTRYVSTAMMSKTDFIKTLETAGFTVIGEYQRPIQLQTDQEEHD
jgi:hypothetical protein